MRDEYFRIKIRVTNEYGQDRYWPACRVGETFAKIAGTKTLTPPTCELIKSLGYYFEPSNNSDPLFDPFHPARNPA